MAALETVAPAFVEMAHRIVWCVAGTTDPRGRPRTRVLHPIWEWSGAQLTGWIATSPLSPKAHDLAAMPRMSVTYWSPDQDTCTAECSAEWQTSEDALAKGWQRFAQASPPVGYDPAIIPAWDSPTSPAFGILRLIPDRLRVQPASLMTTGEGQVLLWRA
ncbi:pyridoxamine 5'-phosphate oxidase family protein [Actinomarinicola tropica]|uniref:Pyridoxamine 5'-phosphate oxidase family protein n=1 Tax=Actinomarinicola tropica TaxID=2789776 RepID=A0A5Q2RDD6_9ACTN|nr:pyridoxamine 5'-phosphate oxidase family protein [Actinomarinicola tropica]QGG94909.1 pyridoxamine 5'-phosphate oxidase family protein [Actinomarinicola tropica]